MPLPQLPPSSPPSSPQSINSRAQGEDGDDHLRHSLNESPGAESRAPSSPEVPLAESRHYQSHPVGAISSDPGLIATSPVRGATQAERKHDRRRKATAKSVRVRAENKATRLAQVAEEKCLAEAAAKEARVRMEHKRAEVFQCILGLLHDNKITIGDFMEYIFDMNNELGMLRWTGFFQRSRQVESLLNSWVSAKNSLSARNTIQRWILNYVKGLMNKEAREITRGKVLQTEQADIDQVWILRYDLSNMHTMLSELAPITVELLHGFATTPRQVKAASELTHMRKTQSITTAVLSLLRGYSQKNNFTQHILSLYLYAAGAQRQVISVLAHLGLVTSYTTLTVKGRAPRTTPPGVEASTIPNSGVVAESDSTSSCSSDEANDTPRPPLPNVRRGRRAGILPQLSTSCILAARAVASTGLFAAAYDNINMVFKSAEQILGRKDTQENGTCSTIWPLWKAKLEDMQLDDLQRTTAAAPPLSISDILLSASESLQWEERMVHTVLRIIVKHGGPGFARYQEDLVRTLPQTHERIELHKTPLHPLPAMDIDESSILGNIDVAENIDHILELDRDDPKFQNLVKLLAGDQLSLARLPAIMAIRAGHTLPAESFENTVLIPGLFHGKMAATGGTLVTHWGKPNAGTRNPGSLAFHNTVLDRKPITISSLPPFRLCRDLIFVSLYARVLHCLLLVSQKPTLDQYTRSVTSWPMLHTHAQDIVRQYTRASRVSALRSQRAGTNLAGGDMVLENAILFMRDALTLREFTDAIKAGDSGRIVTVLKIYALTFRASGRPKYAHEMLHLLHNLTHVWPKPLRTIILNNWLLNPSGHGDGFIEVDLMQEHQNFWVKTVYQAHGSNASWDWLEMISPCVEVLRRLSNQVNKNLGSAQGSKHQAADLNNDVARLMDSLREHEVYSEQAGRTLDSDEDPAADVINAGLTALIHGTQPPLKSFNDHISQLQQRRKYPPLGQSLTHPQPTQDLPDAMLTTPISFPTSPTSPPATLLETEMSDDNESVGDIEAHEDVIEEQDEEMLSLESAADVALDMDDLAEDAWSWLDE